MTAPDPSASDREDKMLRYSIVFVWLATAVVSLWELDGQSAQLLTSGGIDQPRWQIALTVAGACADAALGLWLWFAPGRTAYRLALATMALMTLVATILVPSLWLHPLGPLTKNVPIAMVLLTLMRRAP